VPVVINEDVKSKDLETAGIGMICVNKAVVCILEIRLESDHCLCCQFFDLPFQMPHVTTFSTQFLEDVGKELLRGIVVIEKLRVRLFELLRVLVKRKVRQMHVHVTHVHGIGLSIVLRAKTRKPFLAQIRFYRVDAFDHDVESDVELLVVYQ